MIVTSRDFMWNTFLEELPVGDTYIQTHSHWRPFHGNITETVEDSIGSPYTLTNMYNNLNLFSHSADWEAMVTVVGPVSSMRTFNIAAALGPILGSYQLPKVSCV